VSGKVYFVGAGAGTAELLTVRAARLLRTAEVVLHDELVSSDVLEQIPKSAKVLNVGKRCGKRGVSQGMINELLVRLAGEHPAVVRLKCGDPGIFGRLGEEIDAVVAAGIEYEVVPGITAATAAAASARIPLTDRRTASEVVFATASRARGERREWKEIARPGATLVIYMPGPDYARLASELIASGVPFDVPCAVVSRAGSADEATTYTDVGGLAKALPQAPSIVIVGEVARHGAPQATTPLPLNDEVRALCFATSAARSQP